MKTRKILQTPLKIISAPDLATQNPSPWISFFLLQLHPSSIRHLLHCLATSALPLLRRPFCLQGTMCLSVPPISVASKHPFTSMLMIPATKAVVRRGSWTAMATYDNGDRWWTTGRAMRRGEHRVFPGEGGPLLASRRTWRLTGDGQDSGGGSGSGDDSNDDSTLGSCL